MVVFILFNFKASLVFFTINYVFWLFSFNYFTNPKQVFYFSHLCLPINHFSTSPQSSTFFNPKRHRFTLGSLSFPFPCFSTYRDASTSKTQISLSLSLNLIKSSIFIFFFNNFVYSVYPIFYFSFSSN